MNAMLSITLPDDCEAIALAGRPYSYFAAVAAFLQATAQFKHRFCLGDSGGFGPLPDRTIALIRGGGLSCIQGNYDHAIGYGENDCGCGYSNILPVLARISRDRLAAHRRAHSPSLSGQADVERPRPTPALGVLT